MVWGRRFLSASVVALLLISVLAFAIPLAPVAHAAVATPKVSIDYPYIKIGDYPTNPTRTITVENPLGNPAITRIEIHVPAAAADETPTGAFATGFINTGTVNTAGGYNIS
jgi:hypothetical protein